MGVEKKTLSAGDGVTFPNKGDNVAIHYTGCLYDPSKADNHFMGSKYVPPSQSYIIVAESLTLLNWIGSTAPVTVAPLWPPPSALAVSSRVRVELERLGSRK